MNKINISFATTVKMPLDEAKKMKKSKLMNFFFLFLVCQLAPVNYIKQNFGNFQAISDIIKH